MYSDYYFSKLIPDFFYHTNLLTKYQPTILVSRNTVTLGFLFFGWAAVMKYK